MPPPFKRPIGLQLSENTKRISRAFEDALAEAGGSLPTWLVLLSLRAGRGNTQRELADAVGVRGATLSHHLDGLERDGLRGPAARPGQPPDPARGADRDGEQAFDRLRKVAMAFDQRLRQGLDEAEIDALRDTLERMAANASDD